MQMNPVVSPVAEEFGDLTNDLRGNVLLVDDPTLLGIRSLNGDVADSVLPPADCGLLVIQDESLLVFLISQDGVVESGLDSRALQNRVQAEINEGNQVSGHSLFAN